MGISNQKPFPLRFSLTSSLQPKCFVCHSYGNCARKFCICHSYENNRGVPQLFPFWNEPRFGLPGRHLRNSELPTKD
jgi:hypothetical protein